MRDVVMDRWARNKSVTELCYLLVSQTMYETHHR